MRRTYGLVLAFDLEGATSEDTDAVRWAYELCAMEWGRDDRWLDPETRADSGYGIYQFDTGAGMLVEVFDELQPEIGTLEVAATRFRDPNFKLADVQSLEANTGLSCIREGGYRDR